MPRRGILAPERHMPARRIRRLVTHSGVHAFEAAYAPRTRLPEHEHAAPFFTYVLRGSYSERVGGVSRTCVRGAVMLHHPNETHADDVGPEGTASLNVEIAPALWQTLWGDARDRRSPVAPVVSGDVEWLALRVWREFHRDDAVRPLALDEATARVCDALHGAGTSRASVPRSRLNACVELLSADREATPTLAQVAHAVGAHPMHVARLFRRQFGYSMGEFLRRQRVRWACELLMTEDTSIAAIALRTGFADHAHFTRTFVRVTGCTPRWYRARVRDAHW